MAYADRNMSSNRIVALGSDPAEGTRLDKDSVVSVLVSAGPQPHDIGALSGADAATARQQLEAALVTVGDDVTYFTDAAANTVVSASVTQRSDGAAIDCTNGCSVHEGDTAVLTVSVGPVPDVTGESVDGATRILQSVNLLVSGDKPTETSEDIAEGDVIRIADREGGGNWKPGETVTLVVSSGPPLFKVPNVVGMTRDGAKNALKDAGFTAQYLATWDLFLDAATEVEAQVPAANSLARRGSEVSLRLNVSG